MTRPLIAALVVVVMLAGCGKSGHAALRASSPTTSTSAVAVEVTTSIAPATTLPPVATPTTAAPRPATTVAPRPAPHPVTTTTAPFDEGRLPFVKIFAPQSHATVHRSDQFNGSVYLPDGDKLYLLVYAPPAGGQPGQYYDAAGPVALSADRQSWTSNASGISGDPGVVDTLYAFILPPNQAAAYEASDKSNMHSLPPGIQAEDHVDFVWAGN